jgi:exportin-7
MPVPGAAHVQEVQRNLEPKNRDKFTQNLTIVRHEFRSKV